MAPIPGSGGGTPFNNIVPLRGTAAPSSALRPTSLPPLRSSNQVRRLQPARPVGGGKGAKRANGAGVGGGGVHAERSDQVDNTPIDNSWLLFARTRADKSSDSITLSERMQSWIGQKKLAGLLTAWPQNVSEMFSWGAQSVKSFVYNRGLGQGVLNVTSNGFYAAG